LFYIPALNALVAKDGVTLGQFGIFLLLSYAAGHFIAALGNVLESVLWRPFGGMPSDWVTKRQSSLLSPQQIVALETKVTSRFNLSIGKLTGMDRNAWWPISRQVYADVGKNGKVERIDTFNGNYGLNRGLSAACVALAIVAATQAQWHVVIAWLGEACGRGTNTSDLSSSVRSITRGLSRYFRRVADNARSRPGPNVVSGANIGSKNRSNAVSLRKSSASLSIPSENKATSENSPSMEINSRFGWGSSVTKYVDDAYSP
jgi:hypothetical protein